MADTSAPSAVPSASPSRVPTNRVAGGDDDLYSADALYQQIVLFGLSYLFSAILMLWMLKKLIDVAQQNMSKKWSRNERDGFRGRNGHSWDYCLIFKVHDIRKRLTETQKRFSLRNVVERLTGAGLETKMTFTLNREEVILKLRASLPRLQREAARSRFRVELDSERLKSTLSRGKAAARTDSHKGGAPKKDWVWRPVVVTDEKHICKYDAYSHIWAPYDDRPSADHLWRKRNHKIFRGADRIKLLKSMIETEAAHGGAALSVAKLKFSNVILHAFAIHDYDDLAALQEGWIRYWELPNDQPFDDVAAYFGEKIALYFAWLAFYTTYLSAPAVLGFVAWCWAAKERDASATGAALFAVFACLWSTFFNAAWRRREAHFAQRWGTAHLEMHERERLEFVEAATSMVQSRLESGNPFWKARSDKPVKEGSDWLSPRPAGPLAFGIPRGSRVART
mmetsp:Transcript_26769/g.90099  ORF Transcript_26769/g.90099 Transcript_26769/m.90099 type:complete len:452 (+) Transcript_26769:60-1415(+)